MILWLLFILSLFILLSWTCSSNRKTLNNRFSIKNVIPEIFNDGHKIAIITMNTPNIHIYSQYSEINLKEFCKRKNYTLYIYREMISEDSHGCWNKIPAILNHFNKKHDYLIWVDADAIINNMNHSFEEFITKYPNKDMIVCKDITPERTPFNSGVMIFKNNNISRDFLINTWNYPMPHEYTPYGDQDALNNLFYKDNYPIDLKVLPMRSFNSHPLKFKENDFIIHFMNQTNDRRKKLMRAINYKLGLKNGSQKGLNCLKKIKCRSSKN